jgi:hypothetical protein
VVLNLESGYRHSCTVNLAVNDSEFALTPGAPRCLEKKSMRLSARNEEIAEDQRIHLRALKAIDGFFRAADDGLVVVKGSV